LGSGLACIIPLRLMALLSHSELRTLVCGQPDYSIEDLKRGTTFEGRLKPEHPVVKHFWDVMNEMNHEDRTAFLLFVTGSSRLRGTDNLQLSFLDKDPPDKFLPHARTCFFQLQLPDYSSKDILKTKLYLAMRECVSMQLE